MYKLLHKNILVSIVFSIVLFLMIWYNLVTKKSILVFSDYKLDFLHLISSKISISTGFAQVFFLIIVAIIGILFSFLMHRIKLDNIFNLIPTILFFFHIILCLNFKIILSDIFILLFVFVLLLLFEKTLKLKNITSYFFTIGVLSSIFIILTVKSLFLLPVIFLAVNIFGKNGLKDLLAFLLGFVTIIYLVFGLSYITNSSHLFLEYFLQFKNIKISLDFGLYYLIIILTIIEWLISVGYINNFNINNRKLYTVVFSMLVISAFVLILTKYLDSYNLLFFANIGTMYSSAFIFTTRNKKIKNSLLILVILWSIINTFVI